MQYAENVGPFLPQSMRCKFELKFTSHDMYRGTLHGISQDFFDGTTTRKVHLPVAWAVCRVDQVTVSSTSITPYISLRLFLSFLVLLLWWFSVFDSIIVKSRVFLRITSGLYRHLYATSAALTTE